MSNRKPARGRHNSLPVAEKLWRNVDRSGGPDACWPWIGKSRVKTLKGASYYGIIGVRVGDKWRTVTAQRVALIVAESRAEEEINEETRQALHRCDNPPCCNPGHLYWGTPAQNLRDMCDRGRRGKTGAPGSKNGHAKLTEAHIPVIRARVGLGESDDAIAVSYGVSPSLIWHIRTGRGWKHVT